MREIVLDTETTGLDPLQGHRLVEIGAVELFNHIPTGKTYHSFINPQRDVPREAEAVHGISGEFLKDKPVFSKIADEFLEFIGDTVLIIHNASFDVGFLNAELGFIKRPPILYERIIDTLALAKKRHPMGPNSLDALCKRYGIDIAKRTKHGALLDSELLAGVYLELIGGRQITLTLPKADNVRHLQTSNAQAPTKRSNPLPDASPVKNWRATRHWSKAWALQHCGKRLELSLRGRLLLLHALLVHAGKINGVQHQRRKSAIACRIRKNLPGEGKQHPRAFNENRRMKHVGRKIFHAENPGEQKLRGKHDLAFGGGLCIEMQLNLKIRWRNVAGVDVDRDIDVGLVLLGRQGLGRIGIFKAQVFQILAKNAHGRLGARLGRRNLQIDRAGSLAFGDARRLFCRVLAAI